VRADGSQLNWAATKV